MTQSIQASFTTHSDFIPSWEKAMRCGLMGGRPFSDPTVDVYLLYANWFLTQYTCISVQNLKRALLEIPPYHFAKRIKLFQALNCFARYLVEEGQLEVLYFDQSKPLRPRRHLPPKRITVQEQGIETLLTHCDKLMDQVLVVLLSATGLRVSEAAHLRLNDIELEHHILTVRLAKWGKTRRVGMSHKLVLLLQDYLAVRPTILAHDYLFSKNNGKPIDRYGIATRLEKLGKKAGIPVSPHALRRAFVTINANKGRPLPMLQIACGHNNITTTRSYCLTSEDETIEAMKHWD